MKHSGTFSEYKMLANFLETSFTNCLLVSTRLKEDRIHMSVRYIFLDFVGRFCNSDSFGSRVILSLKIYPPCRMIRFVSYYIGCFGNIRRKKRNENVLLKADSHYRSELWYTKTSFSIFRDFSLFFLFRLVFSNLFLALNLLLFKQFNIFANIIYNIIEIDLIH